MRIDLESRYVCHINLAHQITLSCQGNTKQEAIELNLRSINEQIKEHSEILDSLHAAKLEAETMLKEIEQYGE